ncbi:MBL fold metallo-hydrolase [Arcanobacterium haemolyticum]|nr:MBL fold metallo-hydrolase [Arcanobacterium haemolyticum]
MRLTIIGCSGSMSGMESAASSYLLQCDDDGRTHSIVVDFGPGAMGQLLKYLDPAELDAIVFSHMHTDHCADIVGMQVYRRWLPSGPLPRIDVYAPVDALVRTRQIGGDPEEETYAGEFNFQQIEAGQTIEIGPMVLEFFEAEHTVTSVGVRVSGPSDINLHEDVTFAYTGDTDLCDSEIEMARGVDLLLSEAALEDGRDEFRGVHMTGSRAGELAAKAGAKNLLLTHLQPWTDPENVRRYAEAIFDGPVHCVKPGETYRF